jgi:hypothetical protein
MFPQVETCLPELMPFIATLAEDYDKGRLNSWSEMAERVRYFFSPEMVSRVDAVITGWRDMAADGNGTTLIHVTAVLTALVCYHDFQVATPEQQAMLKWAVLFHDLAKRIESGKRDHIHGFRSAALAGKALPKLGFAVSSNESDLEDWVSRTMAAITPYQGTDIQDNRQLPEIVDGIERVFGRNTPAGLIVKTVLFHMSVDVLHEWPQIAPLTDGEIRQYIDASLLPLLEIMMVVDNDAWAFFDAAIRQRHQEETLAAFARIRQMFAHAGIVPNNQ